MKVLIVDDHTLVRHGLAKVVEESFAEATPLEASTPEQALTLMRDEGPDIALVDVRLADDAATESSGLVLLRELRAGWPEVPVLMLTSFDQGAYAREAMSAGAAGYLLKDSTPADLAQAITVALAGGSNIVSSKVIARLFDEDEDNAAPTDRRVEHGASEAHITEREIQILRLVIAGGSNREIAEQLGLSDKTVKSHLATLYRKMDVANRTQAAMVALAWGLVDAPVAADSATD